MVKFPCEECASRCLDNADCLRNGVRWAKKRWRHVPKLNFRIAYGFNTETNRPESLPGLTARLDVCVVAVRGVCTAEGGFGDSGKERVVLPGTTGNARNVGRCEAGNVQIQSGGGHRSGIVL
ncbi:hypothetical protein TYRP_009690 [Tyrophagus putrescentiae]|nr:hypothetical protein TYRP_009690 [Tyrophagus putrescentiae]